MSDRFVPPAVLLARHMQTALASLGRLSRNLIGSLMTIAVIGIALALPAGLHLLLSNFQVLSDNWDGSTSISVFLKREAPESGMRRLVRRIDAMPQVEEVKFISAAEALEEFRRYSGFKDVLDLLQENPLPAVILLQPVETATGPDQVAVLVKKIKQEPLVERVQIDLQWVKRFAALTHIAHRGVLILGGLLGLAVLLVVGNTIRLEIQNRRDEIEITKLIGATNAFIRRPFLYSGFWFGLLGGLFALLLIVTAGFLISGPAERLAILYNSSFTLAVLDSPATYGLMLGGPLLGLLGAAIAVSRHLRHIEPT